RPTSSSTPPRASSRSFPATCAAARRICSASRSGGCCSSGKRNTPAASSRSRVRWATSVPRRWPTRICSTSWRWAAETARRCRTRTPGWPAVPAQALRPPTPKLALLASFIRFFYRQSMFFKNLTFFRFPSSVDFSEVDTLLPQAVLKPVGALEMSSRGFISPFGREEKEQFSHRIGEALWLTVGGEDKILPGTVVNDLLERRLEEIEEKEGRRPGGRERKRLKDDLLHELLPRAFVKTSRVDAFFDLENGYVAVNGSSQKTAENVMSDVRGLLGSFPAMPLNAEVAPRAILTAWIAGEPLPDGLSLGEECEMKDPAEGGAVVKCQHQELRCDEIDKHLDAGKQVTKLALVFEDNLSFVLGDNLIVRKLKFLDGALDQLEHSDDAGHRAELDARFALQSGEIRRLFLLLEQAFKLSKADT